MILGLLGLYWDLYEGGMLSRSLFPDSIRTWIQTPTLANDPWGIDIDRWRFRMVYLLWMWEILKFFWITGKLHYLFTIKVHFDPSLHGLLKIWKSPCSSGCWSSPMHYNWAWPFLQGNSCNRARRQCRIWPHMTPGKSLKVQGSSHRKIVANL